MIGPSPGLQPLDQRRQVGHAVDDVIRPRCLQHRHDPRPQRGAFGFRQGDQFLGGQPGLVAGQGRPTITQPAATPSMMPGMVSSIFNTACGG